MQKWERSPSQAVGQSPHALQNKCRIRDDDANDDCGGDDDDIRVDGGDGNNVVMVMMMMAVMITFTEHLLVATTFSKLYFHYSLPRLPSVNKYLSPAWDGKKFVIRSQVTQKRS